MTTAQRYLFKMVNEGAFQERERPLREWQERQEAEFQARVEAEERPKREAAERVSRERKELKARLFKAFLPEYAALCLKHGVYVDSCGWDGDICLEMADGPLEIDNHIKRLEETEELVGI